MYEKEFKQRLRQSYPQAILLYGENSYLIDVYITKYRDYTQAKEGMLTLYYEEWNFERAKGFLSQSSLFGGSNLLVVKSDKKIPKKELELLIGLGQKNSDNYFIYSYMGLAKDAKSMQSAFSEKKGGIWVRFFEPNTSDAVAILQQKSQEIGLDIDHYALQHLILVLNNNIALCANELDKLAILGSKVTGKDIDRLVYATAPLATEYLLIDLFNKKPILNTIGQLLALGEDELSLLRSTQYFLNQIFLFHAYIKLHGHVDSLAILGYKLPKHIEEKKAQLALRVNSVSLLKMYEHLLESELLIKQSSATQKEVLIYSMLIKLQEYI
ncbi:MAG: DNA polymerase III subunit delta [Sulfurovum sp.]|nr:DNA polymerase III subunit delta [Sulfurovum sp.]